MFGKIFSIIAGIALIVSFTMPWYKFIGFIQITPLDVVNNILSLPLTTESIWTLIYTLGIPALGVLMILTSIFPSLLLSAVKLVSAIALVSIHVGYYYVNIMSKSNIFDSVQIIETSPGFLVFVSAMTLYFIVVIFAILLSPLKGMMKLVGL